MSGLKKASDMLQSNIANISEFLSNDSRGQQLPTYLMNLSTRWTAEQEEFLSEITSLKNNIQNINNIVAAQNSISGSTLVEEKITLSELCDEAVNLSGIEVENITLKKNYAAVPDIFADRLKLTKILINLLINAKSSFETTLKP